MTDLSYPHPLPHSSQFWIEPVPSIHERHPRIPQYTPPTELQCKRRVTAIGGIGGALAAVAALCFRVPSAQALADNGGCGPQAIFPIDAAGGSCAYSAI